MDWTGPDKGGGLCYIISHLLPCLCVCVGVGTERKEKKQRLDTGSIIIGINNNSHNSSRDRRPKEKNDGLADGAGLDVGIWFNFKLIFPQQAPLAMPRA